MAFEWKVVIYIILIPSLFDNVLSKLLTHVASRKLPHVARDHEINVIKKILLDKLGMISEPHANLNDIPKPIIDHVHSQQLTNNDEYTLSKVTNTAVNAGT